MQIETKQVIAHNSHLLISFHIVDIHGVHIVECFIKGLGYLYFEINHDIENPNFLKLNHLTQI